MQHFGTILFYYITSFYFKILFCTMQESELNINQTVNPQLSNSYASLIICLKVTEGSTSCYAVIIALNQFNQ